MVVSSMDMSLDLRQVDGLDVLRVLPSAVLVAVDGRVIFGNPAALSLFGVADLAALVAREAARAHVLGEDVLRIEERLAAIERGETVAQSVLYRILRPDGTVRVVEWSTLPMQFDGRPALLYSIDDVTVLAEARDSLAVAERHQRDVIETLAEGVIVVDFFGVCSDANPSAARMLGLNSTADLLHAHADLMPLLTGQGGVLARVDHPVWRALEHGEQVRNEVYSVVFPRRVRRVRVSSIPIAGTTGGPGGAVITFDDVTEQLEAIEQVARNEVRFRKLATIAPVAVFETDAVGRCTYVNDCWCVFGGLTADVAVGGSWIDAVHPDDRSGVQLEWQRSIDTGQRFKSEFRFGQRDRGEIFVHCEAAPITGDAECVTGWIGAATDLTAELALREGLRDSEARFRLLVEHSPDVVVRIELSPLHIEYLSPSITDLTGRAPEQFYADPALLVSAIHVDDFDAVVAAFTNPTHTDHMQCRLIHIDGSIRNVEVRSNIIVADGTAKILEATLRDVTIGSAERELLDDLAHRDELTGLLNRRALMAALDVQLASRQPTSLIFLDLDEFKQINDTHGHRAGDELLRVCARRLTDTVREGDLVARLGGDEFVVISSTSHADTVANRLLHEITTPICLPGDVNVVIGVSIGVAHVNETKVLQRSDELLGMADQAMYEAKRRGKQQIFTINEPPPAPTDYTARSTPTTSTSEGFADMSWRDDQANLRSDADVAAPRERPSQCCRDGHPAETLRVAREQ